MSRLIAPVLASLLLAACGDSTARVEAESAPIEAAEPDHPGVIHLSAETIRDTGIRLGVVSEGALPETLRVPGTVAWNDTKTMRVGSFVEGTVVECCAVVGEFVKAGHVLARIHSHEVHDAEANYWTARADIDRCRSELEYAQQAHSRASRLYELKAGSLQNAQAAETSLRAAESALERARAELQRALSHLRFLGLSAVQLSHPTEDHEAESDHGTDDTHLIDIKAPEDGTIVERHISRGTVVTPSDAAYLISDLRMIWVIAQVQEQDLSRVRVGMPARVSVRAYPDRVFSGRVTLIDSRLDPETRTVQVRCEVPNPRVELKAEMYATLEFESGAGRPMLLVPAAAVQQMEEGAAVFVPAGENSFRARSVELGRQSESMVEIVSGLSAGEEIVVAGAFQLKSELMEGQAEGGGHHEH